MLFPVPIALVLLLIGIVRMWRSKAGQPARGKGWILSGTIVLALFAFQPIPTAMLGSIEGQFAPYSSAGPVDTTLGWVVVLAGGVSDDPAFEDAHRLSGSSLLRLVEGMRIARHLPSAKLLLSGGAPFSSVNAADVMRSYAVEFGFDPDLIVVETASRDTKDQAREISSIVSGQRFVLVTSASHMPRAVALFEGQGLAPIAAPTDFQVRKSTQIHPGAFFPSSINIRAGRTALREYLGYAWARLRGQA